MNSTSALPRHEYVETPRQLDRFCQHLAEAQIVCLDTEFVSEDTYRPDLCLVQVAADGRLALIDPKRLDLRPFWARLAEGEQETVVHAGREEFRFCRAAVGQRPGALFDTQIAAGFLGLDYPASYGKLLAQLLGKTLPKGETRTDWRRRPLSERQIEYALQDVLDLGQVHAALKSRLIDAGRLSWFQDEMARQQAEWEAFDQREHWRRLPGLSGLSRRSLTVARELWQWREHKAQQLNRPPRTILRDDLLVELARRAKPGLQQVRAVRGIERSSAKRHLHQIAGCIARALEAPTVDIAAPPRPGGAAPNSVLSQFLSTALAALCHRQHVAPTLVGTAQDVRDYITFRLHPTTEPPPAMPRLAQGWRAEVIGQALDQLLEGRVGLIISHPYGDQPLDTIARSTAGEDGRPGR